MLRKKIVPFVSNRNQLKIFRYPSTENRSLKAWNTADEHLLNWVGDMDINSRSFAIYNDRFGYLTCCINHYNPLIVLTYKSQEKSIVMNMNSNHLDLNENLFIDPLSPLPHSIDIGLIKIPKSFDLFRLFLYQLTQSLSDDGIVLCSFMTRHFSPQLLTIADEFFEDVHQSKAWKKSRLLILKKKRVFKELVTLNTIKYNGSELHQHFGVFSANKIDFATQFLIENLKINPNDNRILDLGSGNGIIAYAIRNENKDCELHLLDDSFLAVESSKLNLENNKTFFHYNDCLGDVEDEFFDLIVSNPPSHFDYETNIDVSIQLFHDVLRCLNANGRFLIVASKHLNYFTHLSKIFKRTITINKNAKFEILECSK